MEYIDHPVINYCWDGGQSYYDKFDTIIESDMYTIFHDLYSNTPVCSDLCNIIADFARNQTAAEFYDELEKLLQTMQEGDIIQIIHNDGFKENMSLKSQRYIGPVELMTHQFVGIDPNQDQKSTMTIREWFGECVKIEYNDEEKWVHSLPGDNFSDEPHDLYAPPVKFKLISNEIENN